jgi:hypothetical protein
MAGNLPDERVTYLRVAGTLAGTFPLVSRRFKIVYELVTAVREDTLDGESTEREQPETDGVDRVMLVRDERELGDIKT